MTNRMDTTTLGLMRIPEIPLQVDANALCLLPCEIQEFVSRLNFEAAVINGFLWDNIIPLSNTDGVSCTKLCAFGSPSRDAYYIWIYNNETCKYEMYCTPYHHQSYLVEDFMATDAIGPILQADTFAQFMHHITFDEVTFLDMCANRQD